MAERALAVRETVDARKQKFGDDDLAEVFKDATEVVVAKGKKVLVFKPKAQLDALKQEALGRSGNLRAPTLKVGKRMLVGFGDAAFAHFFDGADGG